MSKELVKQNAQEVILDGKNSVTFPGFPYEFTALNEKILVTLDQFKSGYECKTCKGKGTLLEKQGREDVVTVCPDCDGKTVGKGGIIIPDSAQVLANSGVVVSMGQKARELCTEYKIGDRVLFGFHSGSMIYTRAGIMFKQMDWYQPWCKIDGAGELDAFDFIMPESKKF